MEDGKLLRIIPILLEEYGKARRKHPGFTETVTNAVCLIAEELGELAREINDENSRNRDGITLSGWRKKAQIEAAHVAVTAIRTMIMLEDLK